MEFVKDKDIICLTETRSSKETDICIQGYYPYTIERPKNHNGRYYGGIIILVKDYLRPIISFISSSSDNIGWLHFRKDLCYITEDLYLGVVYMNPINSSYTKRHSNCKSTWEILESELIVSFLT